MCAGGAPARQTRVLREAHGAKHCRLRHHVGVFNWLLDARPDVMRLELDPERGRRDGLFERTGNWGIWVDFSNCIETGSEPFANADVARDALAVALAAERSIEIKAAVTHSP
jgi:hypothetical protein